MTHEIEEFDKLLDILYEIKSQGDKEICWDMNCDECMKIGDCGYKIRDFIDELFDKILEEGEK